jgi:hypothetical protein
MHDDAVYRAAKRVAEAESMVARKIRLLERERREGGETNGAEVALAASERALELRRARLEALLSIGP